MFPPVSVATPFGDVSSPPRAPHMPCWQLAATVQISNPVSESAAKTSDGAIAATAKALASAASRTAQTSRGTRTTPIGTRREAARSAYDLPGPPSAGLCRGADQDLVEVHTPRTP